MNPEYDYLFKLLVRRDALVAMRARIREREDSAFVSSVEI